MKTFLVAVMATAALAASVSGAQAHPWRHWHSHWHHHGHWRHHGRWGR